MNQLLKTATICASLVLFNLSCYAMGKKEALDSFRKANEFYQNNQYVKAFFGYKSLLNHGFESADLYYNLGNAYYKLEKYALSIWSYEKALVLNPDLAEAKMNLDLANLTVTDKVQELPRVAWWYYWQKAKRLFSIQTWTVLSVIFLWMLALGIYLFKANNRHAYKRLGLYLAFVGFVFSLFFGAIALDRTHKLRKQHSAIITTSNVYVKSAPEDVSSDLFVVHSGLKVEIADELGTWIKIKLSDGKMGWVLLQDIKPI